MADNELKKWKELVLTNDEILERAKSQGFDINNPVYHGTNTNFDKFSLNPALRKNTDAFGRGIYTTPSPQDASFWASVAATQSGSPKVGVNVIPLFLRGKVFDANNPEHLKLLPHSAITDYGKVKAAKELGFDHYRDNLGKTITFDPKNVRSKFAQFDPSKIDSEDLAALIGTSKFPKLGKMLPIIGNILDAKEISEGNVVEGGVNLVGNALSAASPYIERAIGVAEGSVNRYLPTLGLLHPEKTVEQDKEIQQMKDAQNQLEADENDRYKKLALQRMSYSFK